MERLSSQHLATWVVVPLVVPAVEFCIEEAMVFCFSRMVSTAIFSGKVSIPSVVFWHNSVRKERNNGHLWLKNQLHSTLTVRDKTSSFVSCSVYIHEHRKVLQMFFIDIVFYVHQPLFIWIPTQNKTLLRSEEKASSNPLKLSCQEKNSLQRPQEMLREPESFLHFLQIC